MKFIFVLLSYFLREKENAGNEWEDCVSPPKLRLEGFLLSKSTHWIICYRRNPLAIIPPPHPVSIEACSETGVKVCQVSPLRVADLAICYCWVL